MVSRKLLELGTVRLIPISSKNGFHRSESEPMLYTKVNEQGNMLIVYMYVDDLIFTSDFGIKRV